MQSPSYVAMEQTLETLSFALRYRKPVRREGAAFWGRSLGATGKSRGTAVPTVQLPCRVYRALLSLTFIIKISVF